MSAASAVGAYTLVSHFPKALFFSRPSYLGTFVQLCILQLVAWAFYEVLLYPKFLSSLRHLPAPTGDSWWNGQFGKISAEASGKPMREWQVQLPSTYYTSLTISEGQMKFPTTA